MDCISPTAHHLSPFNWVANQSLFHVDPHNTWTVDLARLRHEKDILENGLASCVTYLSALRKRQARKERLLSVDPLPPRKRRKKIQQSKRELDREIKNRQRDEQAFLNNLQACNASIYLAEGVPATPTDFSSTLADYTSSTAQCSIEGSKPAELNWYGWTDDVVVSPFEKKRSNAFFAVDVAPDELVEEDCGIIAVRGIRRPPSLIRGVDEFNAPPVAPNTPQSQYLPSSLSPTAPAFEPAMDTEWQDLNSTGRRTQTLDTLPIVSVPGFEAALARRATAAALCRTMQQLSIQVQPDVTQKPHHSLFDTNPQGSPVPNTNSSIVKRSRTNSL
jgi:hypothetical protein